MGHKNVLPVPTPKTFSASYLTWNVGSPSPSTQPSGSSHLKPFLVTSTPSLSLLNMTLWGLSENVKCMIALKFVLLSNNFLWTCPNGTFITARLVPCMMGDHLIYHPNWEWKESMDHYSEISDINRRCYWQIETNGHPVLVSVTVSSIELGRSIIGFLSVLYEHRK